MKKLFFIFLILLFTSSISYTKNIKEAYFAGGCFWCMEDAFEKIKGVEEVISGYSGGSTENPTYKDVLTGKSGHIEVVQIEYDQEVVSYEELLDKFFFIHDPTTMNRQGPDVGTQYRSIAFYKSPKEKKIIEEEIQYLLNKKTYKKITTQVIPFKKFYIAEDYHQNYKKKNPYDLYIMRVSAPRINKFKMDFKDVLK